MNPTDAATMHRIAERAMVERHFLPSPPPQAVAEAAAAREASASPVGKDLRDLPWTSIDNVESRDLDQIEAAEEVKGGFRLYVAIADVDHFVPIGSAIDAFAGHNTTSVYTGVRTFPMLPERLSFDLSSLLPDRPRAAMVIETFIDSDGAVGAGKMYPALVQNRAQLAYPSVSTWLDEKSPPPPQLARDGKLADQVRLHDRIAKLLGDRRRRDGALDVDTGEARAVVDEHGAMTGIVAHVQDRAGKIVEELMVASNRAVAHALDMAKLSSIRRVVKEPLRWAKIVAYAAERGTRLAAEPSSLELARFVDEMRRTRAADFAEISLSIVKLMGRGEYVAHRPGEVEIGHFGLATDQYTHATAPNRRYVDLITQRLLKTFASSGPAKPPYPFEALTQMAAHASEREAESQKVERRVLKSAAALLLAPRVGEEFDAIVTGAGDKGTFVRVFHPTVEGKVMGGQKGLEVGQKVRVRLRDVSVEKGFIDFEVK